MTDQTTGGSLMLKSYRSQSNGNTLLLGYSYSCYNSKSSRGHVWITSVLEATSQQTRTLGRYTHRGTIVDSLRYGLKRLGSGQVSLLSDILTDTEERAQNTNTPVIADKQKPKPFPSHICAEASHFSHTSFHNKQWR